MAKSILVDSMDYCIFCGSPNPHEHHVFNGPDRKYSEKYGLTVPLCYKHHNGSGDSPHMNRIIDLALKCWAQTVYENKIGDRDSFRKIFRKSYL